MWIKPTNQDHFFLPDLSSGRTVFMLVLISELFVVVQQLALPGLIPMSWSRLAISSFFVQWIVLTSSAFIYLIRPYLKKRPIVQVVAITLCGVAVITLLFTLANQQLTLLSATDWHQIIRNIVVALIIGTLLLRYFYIQHEVYIQQQVIHNARLDSLLGNIRPHFLFNSMNIITSLIRTDPEKAEQVIEDLSDLFRSSLQNNNAVIPIRQEIELSHSYLRIEQNRLGDRLQVHWHKTELPGHVTIPPFTLQPLVENAVYHGIQSLVEGGRINISIDHCHDEVQISVENPMPLKETISRGNRMALNNIRSRLVMLYGDKARLTTEVKDAGNKMVHVARVVYPYNREPGANSHA